MLNSLTHPLTYLMARACRRGVDQSLLQSYLLTHLPVYQMPNLNTEATLLGYYQVRSLMYLKLYCKHMVCKVTHSVSMGPLYKELGV